LRHQVTLVFAQNRSLHNRLNILKKLQGQGQIRVSFNNADQPTLPAEDSLILTGGGVQRLTRKHGERSSLHVSLCGPSSTGYATEMLVEVRTMQSETRAVLPHEVGHGRRTNSVSIEEGEEPVQRSLTEKPFEVPEVTCRDPAVHIRCAGT